MESGDGAKASAMKFSIAETAKANNLNTYEYFEHLLTEMRGFFDIKYSWMRLTKPTKKQKCSDLLVS